METIFMRSIFMASALLFVAGAALADGRAEIRARCEADVKANCGLVMSRSAALNCLIENAATLSGGCTKALEKAACSREAPGNLKKAFTCKP
jgi:hypothetical protein